MKKTLIAFAILMASAAHAQTPYEQYKALYMDNQATYETITPGMTVEYHKIRNDVDELAQPEKCIKYYKEIVVSVDPGYKYLVHHKEIALTDCRSSESKKGETDEYLEWREVDLLSNWKDEEEPTITKVSVVGNIAQVEGYFLNIEGGNTNFKSRRDFTKSQFYSSVEYYSNNFTLRRLIKRSETDLSTLKIDGLDVYDHTDEE
jgi:hypothetical protein